MVYSCTVSANEVRSRVPVIPRRAMIGQAHLPTNLATTRGTKDHAAFTR